MTRARVVTGFLLVAGLVATSTALAGFPKRYVDVDAGRLAGRIWTLGVASREGSRCFRFEDGEGETAVCEAGGKPPFPWQRIMGDSVGSGSLELDITSTRVRRLSLLLGHGGRGGPPTWRSVRTRLITPEQAERAHLNRDFRFAVLTGNGPLLCVEKVRAFSRSGELLEKKSVPCEY